MAKITHSERERGAKREKEQELEEAVTMEMMIILDMLRCCFVLLNIQSTGESKRERKGERPAASQSAGLTEAELCLKYWG
ncbi:hypothetical protein Q5P01_015892 [Channa striata]|uniref:Uncharacterized protein n=1 Tax=Channa striata TaxID=64152 RepID=A0AA88SL03_CHASR|nr:hypothetical protein Q5P01_015892 [Channa striata]